MTARRKPWMAGLLSLIVAGLGQVYNGEGKKGLFLFGLTWVVGFAAIATMLTLPIAPLNIVLPMVMVVSWVFYLCLDAVMCARRQAPPYHLKVYNKWYILASPIRDYSEHSWTFPVNGS
jgi:signal peptidase I